MRPEALASSARRLSCAAPNCSGVMIASKKQSSGACRTSHCLVGRARQVSSNGNRASSVVPTPYTAHEAAESGHHWLSEVGHNRPYASVCFKNSKRDLQRDALVIARLGARYSFAAASSTVSTASGDASSRSLGIALPLLSDSP